MREYRIVQVSKGWVPQTRLVDITRWYGITQRGEYLDPYDQLKYCKMSTKAEGEWVIEQHKKLREDVDILTS
jgi:hypothetical protein